MTMMSITEQLKQGIWVHIFETPNSKLLKLRRGAIGGGEGAFLPPTSVVGPEQCGIHRLSVSEPSLIPLRRGGSYCDPSKSLGTCGGCRPDIKAAINPSGTAPTDWI